MFILFSFFSLQTFFHIKLWPQVFCRFCVVLEIEFWAMGICSGGQTAWFVSWLYHLQADVLRLAHESHWSTSLSNCMFSDHVGRLKLATVEEFTPEIGKRHKSRLFFFSSSSPPPSPPRPPPSFQIAGLLSYHGHDRRKVTYPLQGLVFPSVRWW